MSLKPVFKTELRLLSDMSWALERLMETNEERLQRERKFVCGECFTKVVRTSGDICPDCMSDFTDYKEGA